MASSDVCSRCKGTGWDAADGGGMMLRCSCVTEELVGRRRAAAGVPARYQDKTLDNYDAGTASTKEALLHCRQFAECYPRTRYLCKDGLMLVGAAGVGKTHLAAGVLWELVEKGADCRFVSVLRLFRNLQRTYQRGDNGSEWEVLAPLLRCDVLVVDDLGARRITDWSHDIITELVSERYDERLPTVLTTNYRGEELAARIGVRLMSRLAEVCVKVAMDAPDYRLRS